jgi:hypothetical protein
MNSKQVEHYDWHARSGRKVGEGSGLPAGRIPYLWNAGMEVVLRKEQLFTHCLPVLWQRTRSIKRLEEMCRNMQRCLYRSGAGADSPGCMLSVLAVSKLSDLLATFWEQIQEVTNFWDQSPVSYQWEQPAPRLGGFVEHHSFEGREEMDWKREGDMVGEALSHWLLLSLQPPKPVLKWLMLPCYT